MRSGLGLVGLLVVLAIVAVTVKKQLASTSQALPVVVQPGAAAGGPPATPAQQARQLEDQVKQQVEGLMQPRPMPDDESK